jgi:hypothetical protein
MGDGDADENFHLTTWCDGGLFQKPKPTPPESHQLAAPLILAV